MFVFCFRLLTLWFDYGHWPEVYEALVDGIKTIQIDTWLQVIPQLIARIDTPRHLVGRLIHQLLTDIGKHHPQVDLRSSPCAFARARFVACKQALHLGVASDLESLDHHVQTSRERAGSQGISRFRGALARDPQFPASLK